MKFKALLGLIVLTVIAYTAIRSTAAINAERALVAQIAALQGKGLRVDYSAIHEGGFPYRITLTIEDLKIADRRGGFAVKADQLVLISHVWTPNHWVAEAHSLQAALFDNALVLEDQLVQASFRRDENGNSIVAMDSLGAKDAVLRSIPLSRNRAKLDNWFLSFFVPSEPSEGGNGLYEEKIADVRLHLDNLIIDQGKAAHQRVQAFKGVARLTGKLPKTWSKEALKAWSFDGGLIELVEVGMDWNGSLIRGDGSISLDDDLRPLGSFSAQVNKGETLYDAMRSAGLEPPSAFKNAGHFSPNAPMGIMIQNGQIQIEGMTIGQAKPWIN